MKQLFTAICLSLIALLPSGCDDGGHPPAQTEAVWYESKYDQAKVDLPASSSRPAPQSSSESTAVKAEEDSDLYGPGASLNGFRPFPDSDPWNQRIDESPVDPSSDQILAYIGLDGHLHPDFGAGTWQGSKIGIPYIVVPGDEPKVTVEYQAYGDQSDQGPFPIPFDTPVEGDPYDRGDRHAIVIDRDNWVLYELFRAFPQNGGARWTADSGAIFDLKTNTVRPKGWTSADAAGLPIFPGLVRYDEVGEQKEIRHAIRFTLAETRRAFVPPASHWASSKEHPLLPPLGMRVRLRKDFDTTGYADDVKVILTCLKRYGMILADNGSDWFISGAPDERWNNDELRQLRKVKVSDLEIIKMDGLTTPYNF